MSPTLPRTTHQLVCHPATPAPTPLRLTVSIALGRDEPLISLRHELRGDLSALLLPAPGARPARTDNLWKHSCFEAFVARGGDERYREFNFSPSGDWAAYAFAARRTRDAGREPVPAPLSTWRRDGPDGLVLEVGIPRAALPDPASSAGVDDEARWRIGLTAVIESRDGQLSYWALRHPAPRPDFHDASGWTARLPLSDPEPA